MYTYAEPNNFYSKKLEGIVQILLYMLWRTLSCLFLVLIKAFLF